MIPKPISKAAGGRKFFFPANKKYDLSDKATIRTMRHKI
jgi:hypothetical protein